MRVEHCLLESGQSGFAISTADFDFAPSSIEEAEVLSNVAEKLEEIGGRPDE